MTARLRLVLLSASILAVGAACGSNAASNGATLSVAATAKAADATSSPTTLDLTAAKKAAEKAISGGGGGGGGDDGGGPPGGGDGGGFGPGFGPGGNLDAAATAIGITTADLSTAMAAGQTIAQVAQTRGVNIDVVVDAMVAPIKQHFDDEVGIDHTRPMPIGASPMHALRSSRW